MIENPKVWYAISVLAGYLIGSIPTSVWVGRLFYGVDIREHGSGNAGATNTFRVLGKQAGIPVLLFDVLKGWFPVFILANQLQLPVANPNVLMILTGIAAVIGHIYPLFAGFRGGKGVATLLGVVLGLQLIPALICIGLFLIILILSKYVSLGSVIGGVAFPLILVILGEQSAWIIGFACLVTVLLAITHMKNIRRLINGTENKTYLFGKRELD